MTVTALRSPRAPAGASATSLQFPPRTLAPAAYGEAMAKTIEARAATLNEWAVVEAFDEASKGSPARQGAVADAMIQRLVADKKLEPALQQLSGPDNEWMFIPSTRSPNYMPMVMYRVLLENSASPASLSAWKKVADHLPVGPSLKPATLSANRGRQAARQIEVALDRRDPAQLRLAVASITNTFAAVQQLKAQGFSSPAALKLAGSFASTKLDAAILQLKVDGRIADLKKALAGGAANQTVLASFDALVKRQGGAQTQKLWGAAR